MAGNAGQNHFPTVGRVEADKHIGKENDQKSFGGITQTIDNFVNKFL